MDKKREEQFNEHLKSLKERIEELEFRKRIQNVVYEELSMYSEIIEDVIKGKGTSEPMHSPRKIIHGILSATTQFTDIPWERKAMVFTNQKLAMIERAYQGFIALMLQANSIHHWEGNPYSELEKNIDFEKLEESIKNALKHLN